MHYQYVSLLLKLFSHPKTAATAPFQLVSQWHCIPKNFFLTMKINCPGCKHLFSLNRGFPLHCQHSAGCMQAFLSVGGIRSFAYASANEAPSSTVNELQTRMQDENLQITYLQEETSFSMKVAEGYEDELQAEEKSLEEEEFDEEVQSDNPSLASADSLDKSFDDYFNDYLGTAGEDESDVEVEDSPFYLVSSGYWEFVSWF